MRRTSLRRHVRVITVTVPWVFSGLLTLLWVLARPQVVLSTGLLLLPGTLWVGALLVTWWVTLTLLARWAYAPAVRAAVRDFGYDICMTCGHWFDEREAGFKRCVSCGAPCARGPEGTSGPLQSVVRGRTDEPPGLP